MPHPGFGDEQQFFQFHPGQPGPRKDLFFEEDQATCEASRILYQQIRRDRGKYCHFKGI